MSLPISPSLSMPICGSAGQWDDPAWLTYAGYDLPPLPKYLVGFALRIEGYRRPGPAAMVAWYRDISSQFVSKPALIAARRPSVVFGMVGCLAIYAIGTLALDRRLGFVCGTPPDGQPALRDARTAGHVRRPGRGADPVHGGRRPLGLEAAARRERDGPLRSSAWSSARGSWEGWRRWPSSTGRSAGFILGGWAILAMLLASFSVKGGRLPGGYAGLRCGLVRDVRRPQPVPFAHPKGPLDPMLESVARLSFLERVKVVADHRVNVSANAKSSFPNDALTTPLDKIKAVAVQGFGRFGPFGPRGWTDSTIRFDWEQDRGRLVWLPWVVLGLVAACRRGSGAASSRRAARRLGDRGPGRVWPWWSSRPSSRWPGIATSSRSSPVRAPGGVRGRRGASTSPDRLVGRKAGTESDPLRFLRRPGALGLRDPARRATPTSGRPATGTSPAA